VLRLAWYIWPIRFEIESDGRFGSRFDSNAKNDSQVPTKNFQIVNDKLKEDRRLTI